MRWVVFFLCLFLSLPARGDMFETLPHTGDLQEQAHASASRGGPPSGKSCRGTTSLCVRPGLGKGTLVLYIRPARDDLDLLDDARRLARERGLALEVFFSVSRDRLEDLSRFVIDYQRRLFGGGLPRDYGVVLGHRAPYAEIKGDGGTEVCSVSLGLRCP